MANQFAFTDVAWDAFTRFTASEKRKLAQDIFRGLPSCVPMCGLGNEIFRIKTKVAGKWVWVSLELLHKDLWLILAIGS